VQISLNEAGRGLQLPQKKRHVVTIPKRSGKTDISHVFRAVADAAPNEQAVVVTAFETEIDHLEDKPWRAEGADPSDWFNYGFNEETWRRYCEKQNRLRKEFSMGGVPLNLMQQQSQMMYPQQQHLPPPHVQQQQQQQQHPAFHQQIQAPRFDGSHPRGNITFATLKIVHALSLCLFSCKRAAPSIYDAAYSTPSPHYAGSRP
jgi:hypothetical protein